MYLIISSTELIYSSGHGNSNAPNTAALFAWKFQCPKTLQSCSHTSSAAFGTHSTKSVVTFFFLYHLSDKNFDGDMGMRLLYSTKILRVFNFANFQPFVKIFQQKILTCGMQWIREIISTKCSKIAICENVDPRKFSAIRHAAYKCMEVLITRTATHSYIHTHWRTKHSPLLTFPFKHNIHFRHITNMYLHQP